MVFLVARWLPGFSGFRNTEVVPVASASASVRYLASLGGLGKLY